MAGVSLMEVLISVAIGFVVVVAVLISFIGSGKAGRYQAALTQMNQDAQIGLNMLTREVQLAGYSAPAALSTANPSVISYHDLTCPAGDSACATTFVVSTTSFISGCDGTKGAKPFTDPTATALACSASTGATSAGMAVVYEADVKNTVPTSTGAPSDCLGQAINPVTVAGVPLYYIARNRYYIDTVSGSGATGRPELYCASDKNATSKQPLIENVEDLQVWYGVKATAVATDRQVIRYAKASKNTDNSTTNTVNAAGAAEWNKVISVRICLLMRSEEEVLDSDESKAYLDCNSVSQTGTDRYLRRAYFTTATLRSKMAF
jgi:type IV pilus assembly protein PilW